MAMYTVKWIIDIEASHAKEAAQKAWEIMKEPVNDATFMDVYENDIHIDDYDMDPNDDDGI